MNNLFEKSCSDRLKFDDLVYILGLEAGDELDKVFEAAYKVKLQNVGNKVYLRGIIEFSNICASDCYYCGIRKSSKNVKRYNMSESEILAQAMEAMALGYGSIVIQGGEVASEDFTSKIENVIKQIKKESGDKLGITLSLGIQDYDTYKRWFDAGAHRYLLRIETTNKELFKSLHPESQSFEARIDGLGNLARAGYQVGTGVMIGLPGQTIEDLANDILFFKKLDVDMIGMGPFIPHDATPMADSIANFEEKKEEQLLLGLKMIAATRLYLKDVNIASTTALQALSTSGRERGLLAGANIIMPNVTELKYRDGYKLYNDKPNLNENISQSRLKLEKEIENIGESIGYNLWGDSPHFAKRVKKD